MKVGSELKILEQIVRNLNDPTNRLPKARRYIWVSGIIGLLCIFWAFYLVFKSYPELFGIVLLAILGGEALGGASLMLKSFKQWPIIKPHLNEESIRQRIEELKTKTQ